MNIWLLVFACVCILAGFFWFGSKLDENLNELQNMSDTNALRLADLQDEQSELRDTLAQVDSEAFIENQARTMYGYMMPDEIRFVITNPEALYGEEEIPSR